jgi:hypothetical protein
MVRNTSATAIPVQPSLIMAMPMLQRPLTQAPPVLEVTITRAVPGRELAITARLMAAVLDWKAIQVTPAAIILIRTDQQTAMQITQAAVASLPHPATPLMMAYHRMRVLPEGLVIFTILMCQDLSAKSVRS